MTAFADLPISTKDVDSSIAAPLTPVQQPESSIQQTTGVFVTVHGHFYQPPRENPYLDAIERQPSADPFHDWNERIHHECYRPNAFARILNDRGELVGIVNNYEYMSFNIGPTLMSWLERYDLEVYQRILEADRKSAERLNGHGNAIAQVYNHIIMPLANLRDKRTQIHWGKEDFRSRFNRDPEGMWLAETAIDRATIEVLIAEGIKFIILAPTQALRCRPMPNASANGEEANENNWFEVGGGQIDPTRPYRCFLPGKEEYIDIFFYDGPISGEMGFGEVLNSSGHFAGRIGMAIQGDHRPAQLISVATDGETFGHHKHGKEKCLAYALTKEFPQHGWTVTNFAHYLSLNTPTWEVELKPVTAWSCSHGVNRWQDDCGCGGGGGWHQKWRRPLRNALDWLRDRLIEVYQGVGFRFFRDPWLARDEYIKVIRDRTPDNVERFLTRHRSHQLNPAEQIDALRLLEMQRHSLLMYTSCGWFFEELSRPEGVQILRYAARAIELAAEVTGVQLERDFVQLLSLAPTNIDIYKNGAEVYRELVMSAQVSFKQVAAHYAITSLFSSYSQEHRIYCYTAQQLDYQLQRMGSLSLAVGQVRLVSEITWESVNLVFAVLHLGGWDFHCCIQPFSNRRAYTQVKEQLFAALEQASAAQVIMVMLRLFGDQTFSLQNLFPEERHRLTTLLSKETLNSLDQLYTQVYRDNYGVLMAFHREELPVPQELQVAAEIALTNRATIALRSLEHELTDIASGDSQLGVAQIVELEAIATEAKNMRCQLHIKKGKQTMERLILALLWHVLHDANPTTLEMDIQRIERAIDIANRLNPDLSLERAQELFCNYLHNQIVPNCIEVAATDEPGNETACRWDSMQLRVLLLRLAKKLAVDVDVLTSPVA